MPQKNQITLTKIKLTTFFLSGFDERGVIHIHATSYTLHLLDSVPVFYLIISNSRAHTYHCILNEIVGWPSIRLCGQLHWDIFVYKVIMGELPSNLCNFTNETSNSFPASLLQVDYLPGSKGLL